MEGEGKVDISLEGSLDRVTPPNNDIEKKASLDELVTWTLPQDPDNPKQWSASRRWAITIVAGLQTLVVSFSSSIFSVATVVTAEEFHVSTEVTTLGTSLYILGFALGPIIWGPVSEFMGRWLPLFSAYFCFCVFQVPVGVAQNLETIMLSRFLQGLFGTSPLSVTAGILVDMWGPLDLGAGVAIFGMMTFVGPTMGPVIGSFITASYLGWRWIAWITLIMGSLFGIVALLVIPETFAPVLLSRRAKKLRHETKNWSYHAQHDEKLLDLNAILSTYILIPMKMLVSELILLLLVLYIFVVYSVLYLSLEAFPISFLEQRGWRLGVSSLPFIGMLVGFLLGTVVLMYHNYWVYAPRVRKEGRLPPEARLPPMILGSVLLAAGLFWFGWTSNPHITWIPQAISTIFIGMGCDLIFNQGLCYIVECYLMRANSAMAAATFMRGSMAAAFPLFVGPMFHKMTVPWAMSFLGFLAVALVPVPIAFYYYGHLIRKSSKYCPM